MFNKPNHLEIARMIFNLIGSMEEIKDSCFDFKIGLFKQFDSKRDDSQSFESVFASHSTQVRDLLRKMLVLDPKKRISIDDALNHPLFEDYEDEIEELEN